MTNQDPHPIMEGKSELKKHSERQILKTNRLTYLHVEMSKASQKDPVTLTSELLRMLLTDSKERRNGRGTSPGLPPFVLVVPLFVRLFLCLFVSFFLVWGVLLTTLGICFLLKKLQGLAVESRVVYPYHETAGNATLLGCKYSVHINLKEQKETFPENQ